MNKGLAFVNFAAMTDAEYQYNKPIMFERADDAIISDAILPVIAQLALQALADLSGVFELCDSPVKKF
jgi:hypothetical protein